MPDSSSRSRRTRTRRLLAFSRASSDSTSASSSRVSIRPERAEPVLRSPSVYDRNSSARLKPRPSFRSENASSDARAESRSLSTCGSVVSGSKTTSPEAERRPGGSGLTGESSMQRARATSSGPRGPIARASGPLRSAMPPMSSMQEGGRLAPHQEVFFT